MDFVNFLRAIFALALTLGLIGLAAVVLRRYGPEALAKFTASRKVRRLSVVETLILDPSRRLVIVACDGEERILLLGEGQMIAGPQKSTARKPAPPKDAA